MTPRAMCTLEGTPSFQLGVRQLLLAALPAIESRIVAKELALVGFDGFARIRKNALHVIA